MALVTYATSRFCVNDHVAAFFNISLNAMTADVSASSCFRCWRTSSPTGSACLQRNDRAVLEHGIETGTIRQLPSGGFIEVHQPIGPVDEHGHPIPLPYAGAQVPTKLNQLGFAGAPGRGSLFKPDPENIVRQVEEIEEANEKERKEMLIRLQEENRRQLGGEGHENP